MGSNFYSVLTIWRIMSSSEYISLKRRIETGEILEKDVKMVMDCHPGLND